MFFDKRGFTRQTLQDHYLGTKLDELDGRMTEKMEEGGTEKVRMGRIGSRPYWVLSLSIAIRALHLVGAAVFLTFFLLPENGRPPSLYMAIVFASGAALLFTEWMRHRQICRELSGASTLLKLVLLGGAYHGFLPAREAVLLVFVLAALASHAPKLVRHRLLF